MSVILKDHSRKAAVKRKDEPEHLRKGIFWDKPAGQYATRIGYLLDTQTGRRDRSPVQRLGADPDRAIIAHANLRQAWEEIGDLWTQYEPKVLEALPRAIRAAAAPLKPVWVYEADDWVNPTWNYCPLLEKLAHARLSKLVSFVAESVDRIDAAKASLTEFARRDESPTDLADVPEYLREEWKERTKKLDLMAQLPPDLRARVLQALAPSADQAAGISASAERLTLAQAQERFKTHLLSREGLSGEDGLKFKSIRGRTEAIGHCLAIKIIDPATGELALCLPPTTPLEKIDYDGLHRLRNTWMRSVADGKHSRRTAANYLLALRKLLDWAHKSSGIAYRHPADVADLFTFKRLPKATPPKYEEGIAQIKAILSADITTQGRGSFNGAKKRAKLYILLGLNLGAYGVDIGGLRHDDLRQVGEDWFVTRRRAKTSHQNNFESTHYLWPETYAAMKELMAPADPKSNPSGLILLDEGGGPLYDPKRRKDLIGKVYRSVRRAARIVDFDGKAGPVGLEMKALRKLGATWMENHFGQQARRMYKAGTLTDGDEAYVRDDYAKLTPALMQWREELKADGVL